MKNLIKQDLNFLEYPLYGLNERALKQDIEITLDGKKYELTVGYKTPNSTDMLYLYYFMKKSQEENFKKKIFMERSNIIKEVAPSDTVYYYKRLNDTLKIWRNVGLSFQGSFYDGKKYRTLVFGVLDYGEVEEDGTVCIAFNEIFLKIFRETNFYRYIDFNELKKLRKPVSRRLYEIFKKSSFPFKIEIKKLAQKLTLDRKYPSDIIIKLKPAVNEINKNTDFDILFSYKKNETGKTICIFEKMVENQLPATAESDNESSVSPIILKAIPKEYQVNSVFKIIEPYYDKPDYVISNIKYTNGKCDKNYPAYLKLALQEDYAKVNREVKVKKDKIVQDKKYHIQEKENQEKLLKQKAWDYFNSLPEGEQFKFRSDAKEKMSVALKIVKIPERRNDIINAQIEIDLIQHLEGTGENTPGKWIKSGK